MLDADGAAASPNNILYWKYDNIGRVIEKGYYNDTWGTAALNVNNEAFPATPATWRKKYDYDDASITPYSQGKLCKVQTNNGSSSNVDVEQTFQYDKFGNTILASDSVVGFAAEKYSASYDYDYLGRVTQIYYPAYKVLTSLQNITVGSGSENDASSTTTMTAGSSVIVQNGGTMKLDAKQSITLTPGFTAATGSNFKATTGMVVTYTYNELGQVSGVGNSSNSYYFDNYNYNADGTLQQERINNFTSTTNYSYNSRGFPTSISDSNFTESLAYSNTNTYYNGSISTTSFSYGAGGPTGYSYTYQYDQNNRMTSAVNSANSGYSYTNIQYDNNGNWFDRYQAGNIEESFTNYSGNKPSTYMVNTGVGGPSYSILNYDADGNLTNNQYEGITAAYDPFTNTTQSMTNQSNAQTTYQYDGSKERILKTVNGTKTMYVRGTNDYPLTEKSSMINRYYIYGPTGLIAIADNGTTYFVLKDHLGSTRVVLNSSSKPVTWYDYTPYGALWRSTISEDSHYRFTGQEYDAETNLNNFRARIYDPFLGIFYASDPAGQGFSPYMYCGGNPTMYVDKDGRIFGIDDIILLGIALGAWISGSSANHWQLNPTKWDWHNPDTWVYTIGGGIAGWAAGGEIAAANPWTVNLGANLLDASGKTIASIGATLSEVGTPASYLSGVSAGVYGLDVFYNGIKSGVNTAENEAGDLYNSPLGRALIPDFVSFGVGFNGIAGVGAGTSFDLDWETRGKEASWFPMVTATQSVGLGWEMDGTFNVGGENYWGPVEDIRRSMLQTSSPNGDIPTFWASFGGSADLGKLGFTLNYTPNVYHSFLVGRELNIGAGLIPGLNGGAGISNTWILYDWR